MKKFYITLLSILLLLISSGCNDADKPVFDNTISDDKAYVAVPVYSDQIMKFNWAQKLVGEEISTLSDAIKNDQKESQIAKTFSIVKKDDNIYDVDIKYYKKYEKKLQTLAQGTFKANEEGTLISTTDNKAIGVSYENDDQHIKVSYEGKSMEYFKAPDNMNVLYGDWKVQSDNDHFISDNLINWHKPERDKNNYSGNYDIKHEKYKLKFFDNTDDKGFFGYFGIGSAGYISFKSNQKPELQDHLSIIFSDRDKRVNVKRFYILDYDPFDKRLTTLIWYSYKRDGKKSEYSDKFVKVNWKKQ